MILDLRQKTFKLQKKAIDNATGSIASEITLSILSDMNIYKL